MTDSTVNKQGSLQVKIHAHTGESHQIPKFLQILGTDLAVKHSVGSARIHSTSISGPGSM